MLPAKRQARILEILRAEKIASLQQLSDALDISLSTIRRDVEYLCASGHLSRTHGGAVFNPVASTTFEPAPALASEIQSQAKAAIGAAAARMIKPGQSVLFDSGTTTGAAAKAAVQRNVAFTAMTNDLSIASCLAQQPLAHTSLTGGTIRAGTSTLIGSDAMTSIARLYADLAFIGTHALTPDTLSDTSVDLADLKRTFMGAAKRVILLVDSSKFFDRAFCAFGAPSQADVLLTDSRTSQEAHAALIEGGVMVEIVDLQA